MLPDSVTHLFLTLFLVCLVVFVLIPALIGYWRLAHGSLSEGRVRLEDVPAISIALVLTNAFCYLLGSGSAHPMTPELLRTILIGIDLLFALFLLDILIVSWLTRNANKLPVPEQSSQEKAAVSPDDTSPLSSSL